MSLPVARAEVKITPWTGQQSNTGHIPHLSIGGPLMVESHLGPPRVTFFIINEGFNPHTRITDFSKSHSYTQMDTCLGSSLTQGRFVMLAAGDKSSGQFFDCGTILLLSLPCGFMLRACVCVCVTDRAVGLLTFLQSFILECDIQPFDMPASSVALKGQWWV